MSKSNERLVHNTLKTLGKDFIVVGKTRVRSWHAWLAIGVAVGVAAGVLFVANRSGEFEAGLAQVLPIAPTSGLVAHWKFDEGSGTTVSDSSCNGNTGTVLEITGFFSTTPAQMTNTVLPSKEEQISNYTETEFKYPITPYQATMT